MLGLTLAYNLLDLTTSVQDDLKDTSFSSTRIRRYLNHAQKMVFNTHNFKFCEKIVSGSLTIGEYTFDQQTDHESTIGGTLVDPTNTSKFVVLNRDNYLVSQDFFTQYPNIANQTNRMPSMWTEYDGQFYFDVPVDKAYTFIQRYYRSPTGLVSDTDVPDVPEEFRELLEMWASYRAEKYRGNHDVAATYKQEFEDELENMVVRYASMVSLGPVPMQTNRKKVYYD